LEDYSQSDSIFIQDISTRIISKRKLAPIIDKDIIYSDSVVQLT